MSTAPAGPEVLPESLGRRYLLEFDTSRLPVHRADVLVVGSGIAGLTAALAASAAGATVSIVTKARVTDANTWYAQGGIAGAVGEADSAELHLADTLVVGQGLCEEDVVRAIVGEAPEALRALQALGMHFDEEAGGAPALAREGGHSLPRVLHSGDATGAAVQNALSRAVRNARAVALHEERFVVDLLTAGDRCAGALVLDPSGGGLEVHRADAVVLATGGCGQVYRVTTNPVIATGDGVAAAWRAGAEIADMEFVQFHPTALDSDAHPKFLITEALRGEGAYLLDCDEKRFMPAIHPMAELAPRDVVSRAMQGVMARCKRPNVWLDARHLGRDFLSVRFPTVWQACADAGFDLSSELVPVAPAAHYLIGGARTDVDGHTSLPGLWACGEAACSGLHGANRLASNSLLEGLVASRRMVRALTKNPESVPDARIVAGPAEGHVAHDTATARESLQLTMTANAGMTREEHGLEEGAAALATLGAVLMRSATDEPTLELQNLVTVATLITHAAWLRRESRGCHSRADHPERDDANWRVHAVWRRDAGPRMVPVGRLGDLGAGEPGA